MLVGEFLPEFASFSFHIGLRACPRLPVHFLYVHAFSAGAHQPCCGCLPLQRSSIRREMQLEFEACLSEL